MSFLTKLSTICLKYLQNTEKSVLLYLWFSLHIHKKRKHWHTHSNMTMWQLKGLLITIEYNNFLNNCFLFKNKPSNAVVVTICLNNLFKWPFIILIPILKNNEYYVCVHTHIHIYCVLTFLFFTLVMFLPILY